MYFAGIDFGTSSLKASCCRNGKVMPVMLSKISGGNYTVPNIIARRIKKDGSEDYIIGRNAIDNYKLKKDNVHDIFYNIKKLFANEKTVVNFFDGKKATAEALTSIIFQKTSKIIADKHGAGNLPDGVVVTVPVCFSEIQKKRIKRAAEDAGLTITAVLAEPVAAIFSTNDFKQFQNDKARRLCVVVDIGGGTIDAALIRLSRNPDDNISEVTVLGKNGDNIGGSDITEAITEKLIRPNLNGWKVSEFDLFDEAERVKINLLGEDHDSEVTASLMNPDGDILEIEIRYDEILDIIKDMGFEERITKLINDIFEDTSYAKEDVDSINLIGGGSYLEYFKKVVCVCFGKEPDVLSDSGDPVMNVSKGAAAFAEFLSKKDTGLVIKERLTYSVLGTNKDVVGYLFKGGYTGEKSNMFPLYANENEDGTRKMNFYQVAVDATDKNYRKRRAEADGDVPPDGVYMGCIPISDMDWELEAEAFRIMLCDDGTFECEIYGADGLLDTLKLNLEDI